MSSRKPTAEQNDLNRLRREYADRERRLTSSDIYSPFNKSALFTVQQRQRDVLDLLKREGFDELAQIRILEIGCGRGGVLLEYLNFGVSPSRLHGAEFLPERVHDAQRLLPHLPLTCADGQHLPYGRGVFDLVLQYTVFSSILDDSIKQNVANEMLRVLNPDGIVFWYDFWLNPTNPQARGIRPTEIRHLFPGCRFVFRRITLAPPLARRLVPFSWVACAFLEKMSIFNTHFLVAIRPAH